MLVFTVTAGKDEGDTERGTKHGKGKLLLFLLAVL